MLDTGILGQAVSLVIPAVDLGHTKSKVATSIRTPKAAFTATPAHHHVSSIEHHSQPQREPPIIPSLHPSPPLQQHQLIEYPASSIEHHSQQQMAHSATPVFPTVPTPIFKRSDPKHHTFDYRDFK